MSGDSKHTFAEEYPLGEIEPPMKTKSIFHILQCKNCDTTILIDNCLFPLECIMEKGGIKELIKLIIKIERNTLNCCERPDLKFPEFKSLIIPLDTD